MASKINGLTTIPAEIREMTKDEAIIIMCESNLQRTKILPSEKAFSYRMRLEAMKRQAGRPRKGNSAPVGQNFSREELAEQTGDSHSQIQRYIRLTYLIPELLKMVDEEKIAFRPAVELSYLAEQEQRDLVETIGYEDATPSQSQAIKMREMSKAGTLTMDAILNIMSQKKAIPYFQTQFNQGNKKEDIIANERPMDKTSVSDENQLFETLLLGLKVKATTKEAMLKLYHKFGFDAACFKKPYPSKRLCDII